MVCAGSEKSKLRHYQKLKLFQKFSGTLYTIRVNHAYARSQAKIMARVAADMENTSASVSDKTWTNLIVIGGWAKKHAPHPSFVAEEVIPDPGAKRTWTQVRHAALAIVDSVTGKQEQSNQKS